MASAISTCERDHPRLLPSLPQFGINRRELDRILNHLGGTVRHLRRTGEIAYSHPLIAHRPKADGRRKDAPAHLVKFVRRAVELSLFGHPTELVLPPSRRDSGRQRLSA